MTVRSERLAGPLTVVGAGVWQTVYTVPPDRRTIVKYVTVIAFAVAVAGFVQVGSNAGGADAAMRHFANPVGVIVDSSDEVWIVLAVGESLRLFVATGTTAVFSAHGAALDLTP